MRREFGEQATPSDLVRCFLHWCSVHDDQGRSSHNWIEFGRMAYALDTNRYWTREDWQTRACGRKPDITLHRQSRALGAHGDEEGLAIVTVGDWGLDTVTRTALDPQQAQELGSWLRKWSRRAILDGWRTKWMGRMGSMRAEARQKLLGLLLRLSAGL